MNKVKVKKLPKALFGQAAALVKCPHCQHVGSTNVLRETS
jgi:phage FluMu protein Com